ncbi:MAG: nucleoside kinase [Prevotella sp.]|nr:nucleoside kinase [Prevotella sp.]
MEQLIRIRCKNNQQTLDVASGSTLAEVYGLLGLQMEYGPVSARVNNKVEGMHYRVYKPKDIEFLSLRSPSGIRAYTRTLFFVLCKAAHELWPGCKVIIDIPVSNGYYVDVERTAEGQRQDITPDDVYALRERMQQIIDLDLPIHRFETTTEEAVRMFSEAGSLSKAKLLEGSGRLYTTYYDLDGYKDYYYGTLLTSTGQLHLFGLEHYYDGLLLRIPSQDDPSRLGAYVRQDKMFEIFKEHHRWQDILRLRTVGDLNDAIRLGYTNQLIQISEALQEKKISQIADEIAGRTPHGLSAARRGGGGVKMVLIAGPSSSGKTTTCKRLSVQLAVNGIRPVEISLDDYFLDREQTPRDASGDYDFEHLHALNIPLLNEQMNALFRGEEVELPRYNFQQGRSEWSGKRLRLEGNEVLVVEGIHALNPELTKDIPDEQIFRVYASALTTILLDNHNYIPTTDNRLLRRIIRDHKYRGVSAQETIRRWPSVRRGENRWIFPFQENADAMFNSAMLFELAVIKSQAEPLLEQVPENCEEYAEAYRLRKFLAYIRPIPEAQIPPTSLLREFLGGSSFEY